MLVSAGDLGLLLGGLRFEPKVSVSDGEFVVRLPELRLIAGGSSYQDALRELAELAEQQAVDVLELSHWRRSRLLECSRVVRQDYGLGAGPGPSGFISLEGRALGPDRGEK